MNRSPNYVPTKRFGDKLARLVSATIRKKALGIFTASQARRHILRTMRISEREYYILVALHGITTEKHTRRRARYCPHCGIHLRWLKEHEKYYLQ